MPNIGAANISKIQLTEQGSDPATPADTKGYIYAKSDGLYFIGDDGVVRGPLVEAGQVKLDDWAATDDNTDLNVSTTAHGLTPKLNNTATTFLNGQGAWTTPAGTGMSNPMTTAGDIIKGGASGTPERLAIGTDGYLLASNGTTVAWEADIRCITFVIDGGGSEIADGVAGDLEIPFACTINAWTLLADQSGAIKIDVWMDTYANYPPTDADSICNAHEPEIAASGTNAQDTDLSDWADVTIAAGQTLRFNVDSCTTIEKCTLALKVTRT